MDRAELEHLLQQVDAEKKAAQHELVAQQERVTKLTKAADGLRALLEVSLPEVPREVREDEPRDR